MSNSSITENSEIENENIFDIRHNYLEYLFNKMSLIL